MAKPSSGMGHLLCFINIYCKSTRYKITSTVKHIIYICIDEGCTYGVLVVSECEGAVHNAAVRCILAQFRAVHGVLHSKHK
jgi:hypothetical protein